MDDDQQFCLRWNNHQSTLVSVFDNLLEKGTLVDCTLFAEGKYLKAHKVVLSACSPYFETLLTQQYDKHPIFILKDVKFQELKAMMDYMYRGEVNISQDQLAALLKAAESLQIKGLSDSRSKEGETRKTAVPPPAKTPPPAPAPTLPRVQGLTIEQRKAPKLSESIEDSRSREGSTSPVPRKRKKARRRPSQDGLNDNHDASSSSESHSNQAPVNIPSLPLPAVPLASTSKLSQSVTDVPEPVETKSEIMTRQKAAIVDSPQVPIKEKLETHSELILEPKSEYIEEDMNEDSVEDLTLDDDDVSQMEHEMDQARPGPSHGSDGSAQDPLEGFSSFPLPLEVLLVPHPEPLLIPRPESLLLPRPEPLLIPRPERRRRQSRKEPRIKKEPYDIDAMLEALGPANRKYPRQKIKLALDHILNKRHSVASTSRALEMNRTTVIYYLRKCNIGLTNKKRRYVPKKEPNLLDYN